MSEQTITEDTEHEVEGTDLNRNSADEENETGSSADFENSQHSETPEETEVNTKIGNEEPEQEGKPGNQEAAKWRVRFREAEATIATLEARVSDMQAAEVSRLATGPGRLHDGSDLLTATRLADLLDDEGNVDPETVEAKIAELVERKPHLGRPAFEDGVGIGQKSAATGATWADVIGS